MCDTRAVTEMTIRYSRFDMLYKVVYIVQQEVNTMRQQISVSQARARLSQLLKKLQEDPELVFEITVNDMVLGELRSPESTQRLIRPGQALSRALEALGEPEVPTTGSVAREHDQHLYSKQRS